MKDRALVSAILLLVIGAACSTSSSKSFRSPSKMGSIHVDIEAPMHGFGLAETVAPDSWKITYKCGTRKGTLTKETKTPEFYVGETCEFVLNEFSFETGKIYSRVTDQGDWDKVKEPVFFIQEKQGVHATTEALPATITEQANEIKYSLSDLLHGEAVSDELKKINAEARFQRVKALPISNVKGKYQINQKDYVLTFTCEDFVAAGNFSSATCGGVKVDEILLTVVEDPSKTGKALYDDAKAKLVASGASGSLTNSKIELNKVYTLKTAMAKNDVKKVTLYPLSIPPEAKKYYMYVGKSGSSAIATVAFEVKIK
jgi:hypothetical protein